MRQRSEDQLHHHKPGVQHDAREERTPKVRRRMRMGMRMSMLLLMRLSFVIRMMLVMRVTHSRSSTRLSPPYRFQAQPTMRRPHPPFLFDYSASLHFKSTVRNASKTPLRIFVLAGGRSSRMGRDKSRLLLGARSFLERIIAQARELDAPVETVTRDDTPGLGPVGGVATAFSHSQFEHALFLSCDTPLVTADLLRQILALKGERAVFTRIDGFDGFPFLLPRAAHSALQRFISANKRSIQDLSSALHSWLFEPNAADSWQLMNVNSPADYKKILSIWNERHRSKGVLEVRRLTVQRGGNLLISDFSWQVRKGEHWAVLGPNGCGKTSLFASLLGYVTPTRGDIFVLGQEYGDADWPELRKKIGLVSSSIRQMLPETEPAWITVASGKYAMIDFWGTPRKRDRADALDLLRRIECEYLADRPWALLSQGERQRILIARALIANPALLILDEPCAGLDPAAREHFLHFLDRLGRGRACPSLVLVTHHVEELMPVFTHGLLMKKGRKLVEGPIISMLNSARLTEAFDTPIRVQKRGARYFLSVQTTRNLIA
jgi:iron complex transport system ATP-binding protein